MELKRVKFIQNPRSGFIKSPIFVRKLIELTLEDAPFDFDFSETQYRGHAKALALESVKEGYDAIVAVGGDGTANEIATALVHKPAAMGIIPTGSGNGLARGVNIPVSVRRAVRLLINGRIRQIDAGKIEDRYYFVVAGVGFDALVGKLFDDRSLRGPLPYFTIGFREFFYYKPEIFVLRFNGKQVVAPALLVAIANTKQWGNGAIISPHAEVDDGLLDVCILHRINFLYALYHLPKLFNGQIDKIRKYERYQTREVEIIRQTAGPYHADGEPGEGGQTLRLSVEPRALCIITPQ
ncbi:diacylglycerol kinase family lipid kinase [candidate division KSB1 bacterium]|nr:diacylglycerol kinase family lipid kinase [candidate division KSB1 bacterium]